ncbi:MAG: prepilin-type N-terminal cleavage/methylation domain-containing protein [Planctomycetes bacterium]|nr:prepilin-type N-terminal cleavage/methylation domain-containing protein [Planctomycetota bacterium]
MIRAIKNKKGFSLIETLVASAILSGSVLTLGAISTMAVSGTRLNRQYEVAASLLDKQLNLVDYIGIDEFVDLGQMEGIFEEYPDYHWEVVTEYQDIDSLYLVSITVSWINGNHPYSISADTMLNGVSAYIEIEIEVE